MVVAVAAFVAATSGIAVAAIPGPDGTIKACYDTNGLLGLGKGHLRVIDHDKSCKSGETPLTWNQQGPKGEPGAPGVSGREIVREPTDRTDADTKTVFAACPKGKVPVGGGASVYYETSGGEFPIDNVAVTRSEPSGESGWAAIAEEAAGGPTHPGGAWALRATAICVTAE
jgi:hypothetical protein